MTEEEIDLLAKILWVEARGESVEGQKAVVEVIFNRMVSEKFFGIKLELNYAQRGFNDKDGHRQFDYIELPFMSHITFGQKLFRFFIDLGPEVSYLIKDYPITSNSLQHSSTIKNKFDYGLVGGLGFEFNTKYGIYTVDARYNFGLNNIFGNSATNP